MINNEIGDESSKDLNNKSMDEVKEKARRQRRTIKKRKERDQKLKSKKIKNEIIQKINEDNFSIIQDENQSHNNFHIEHMNELVNYGQTKIFGKFLKTETVVSDLAMTKNRKYLNLENCSEINGLYYICDKNEIMKNKIKSYRREYFNKDENGFIANNKKKYSDSEIKISLNEIEINIEKNKKRKIYKTSENGIPISEVRLGRKISNISNIEKAKHLINCIQKENIIDQLIKERTIPTNYYFCINCYECYSSNDIINHKSHFILKIDYFKDIEEELDYNEKLQNFYEILRKEQNKILKNASINLINYYKQLLLSLYEIIINENSYEELYSSIINIIENYYKEKKLKTFSDDLELLFFIFCQKIALLAYLKAKEISINESDNASDLSLDELSEENILNKNNFDELNDEDKKKYFFELGFSLKNKNDKNISINDLYNRAKEENISCNDYKIFFDKEFNTQN